MTDCLQKHKNLSISKYHHAGPYMKVNVAEMTPLTLLNSNTLLCDRSQLSMHTIHRDARDCVVS